MKNNENPAGIIRWIFRRLRAEFGEKKPRRDRDLVSMLVLTILSQNTSDFNRDRAFKNLRQRFRAWEELLHAQVGEIEKVIRVGGLSRQKSVRIKQILSGIRKERGSLDLSFLCRAPVNEARAYLLKFKGVGEKTAAVLLLFGCGMPVFPVDTHIFRASKRIGIVPEKADEKKAHVILGALVPAGACHELHLNMIELGKKVCHPRKPNCPACPLKQRCRFHANTVIDERAA